MTDPTERRRGYDNLVHRYKDDAAAFSLCGQMPRSFAGPLTQAAGPVCTRCWPPPPRPAVALMPPAEVERLTLGALG